MTGFASAEGRHADWSWTVDIRSVNGKGLDLRLRLPDWIDGLETALRGLLGKAIGRGNVTLSLKISRDDADAAMVLNEGNLSMVMDALGKIEAEARAAGLTLAPTSAADIAQIRGVLDQSVDATQDTVPLRKAILAQSEGLLADFNQMRGTEGAALCAILQQQLDDVARLTREATEQAEARKAKTAEILRGNLQKVLEATAEVDQDRLAQELALLAVKSDVMEELDRLTAHVSAAHDLLSGGGTVGRKLDFLLQEFNREANTLCAKSQDPDLTRTGLALKAVIDQMREQVQNVE